MYGCLSVWPACADAEVPPTTQGATVHELSMSDRMYLARQFVARVNKGFAEANYNLGNKGLILDEQIRRMPEGEELLFNIYLLESRLTIQAPIMGRAEKGHLLLSLRDFSAALEFPIEQDPTNGSFSGWYIRENKKFLLDPKARTVTTPNGTFTLSEFADVGTDDVLVPISDLQNWFGLQLKPSLSTLEINLISSTKLPVEERLARQSFKDKNVRLGPPELPPIEDQSKVIDYPFVDVSTTASYRRDGASGLSQTDASASIRTAGDFANGTLTTQTQLEKEEKLSSIRANYKQESLKPELLGPLKARRFELGDVNPGAIPLQTYSSSGLGARVTNVDPLLGTLRPTTEIRGTTFPNWDVELYRGDQLLALQTTGDDGVYAFENVDLFETDNTFRVVLYGPQGEVREEQVSIPVDATRMADRHGIYDITVDAQDNQTYRKRKSDSDDQDAPNVTATYETGLGDVSSLLFGLETGSKFGEFGMTGHAGISTRLGGVLYNFDTAIDDQSEMAADLVARRAFGEHQIRNELRVATDKFKSADNFAEGQGDNFNERFLADGPIPWDIGIRPHYNLGLGYAIQTDGNSRMDYNAGVSTSWGRISGSEQLNYASVGGNAEDTLTSITSLNGSIGANRLRLTANYDIKPESRLDLLTADVRRSVTRDMELEFSLQHQLEPAVTQVGAQMNWNAGFANISPSLTYDTDQNLIATLNTRFGLAHDPTSNGARMYDRSITSNGGVSAFVFLDKNGDNQFNGDDEKLPNVVLHAPQNGGSETTDENGQVLFTRLSDSLPTDIYVDESTLGDPFWISGFKGASVTPHEGHVTKMQFPIHIAGEMDGTVFSRNKEGGNFPLRGISVSLYDMTGKKFNSVYSETDGYYILEKIPPGQYYLTIDGRSFGTRFARPMPQLITIGYDGTTIYGKNIYMQEGQPDVPVRFVQNTDALNLNVAPPEGRNLYVTLGTYKSRLMMALSWFKIRSLFGHQLDGLDIVEKPSDSYPDVKTGNYALRLTSESGDLKDTYNKCRVIRANGQDCSIDIVAQKPDAGKVAAK